MTRLTDGSQLLASIQSGAGSDMAYSFGYVIGRHQVENLQAVLSLGNVEFVPSGKGEGAKVSSVDEIKNVAKLCGACNAKHRKVWW